MKIIYLIPLVFWSAITFAQTEHKPESKVIEATIFRDRALVKRSAKVNLPKGNHRILFSGLTVDLLDKSVRIEAAGSGSIKILDVKVERRFTAELQQEELREMEKKLEALRSQYQIELDKIEVLENKKQFIQSLQAESAKIYNQKMLLSPSSVKEWDTMLNFIENRMTKIFTDLRKSESQKNKIEQDIRVIQMEINQSKGIRSKNYKEIIALIETDVPGEISLSPSYLVNNATWYPIYDARVFSDSKQLELFYFGMVQQSTGEDWNEIDLTLSTSEPMTIQSLPTLESWFVDTKPIPVPRRASEYTNQSSYGQFDITYEQNYGLPGGTGALSGYVLDALTGEPLQGANIVLQNTRLGSSTDPDGKFYIPNINVGAYSLRTLYIGYEAINLRLQIQEKQTAMVNIALSESAIELDEVISVVASEPEIMKDMTDSKARVVSAQAKKPSYSNVVAKELSTIFKLPIKSTIPSTNSPHKVTMSIASYPVLFEYTTIPKIAPKVYLKGKVFNNQTFPLLEGEMNIFVDNDFISRSFLETIVASDTFDIALGTDDKIPVEKVLVNKFTESGGFLSGKTQITYTYEIQITNNRQSAEEITVIDQLPVSMNEEIDIDLIEPGHDPKKLDKEKKLIWKIKLKSGEKKIIPLKFKISHPSDIRIYGLE